MSTQKLLAPEVLQSSRTDCGPAALASALAGFGLDVGYAWLRSSVGTSVDGTSVEALAAVAERLGLRADRVVAPVGNLLLPEAGNLPALVLIRAEGGLHFVLVWRTLGPWVQVMDPASGRRWMRRSALLDEVATFPIALDASKWRAWASSPDALLPLRKRAAQAGVPAHELASLVAWANEDPSWPRHAALDGSIRMVGWLVAARGLKRGLEAIAFVRGLLASGGHHVPAEHRWVRPGRTPDRVTLVGALVLRLSWDPSRKRQEAFSAAPRSYRAAAPHDDATPSATATAEGPARSRSVARWLFGLVRAEATGAGSAMFLTVAVALAAAALIAIADILVLRSLVDVAQHLALPAQRLAAVGVAAVLVLGGLLLEAFLGRVTRRTSLRLDARLRILLFVALARVPDAYLRDRPASDVASRAQAVHLLASAPSLAIRVARAVLALASTALALACLFPAARWLAIIGGLASLVAPALSRRHLARVALRMRTHATALGQTHLDALLGAGAIRAHGGARTMRREHENRLSAWVRSAESFHHHAGNMHVVHVALATFVAAGIVAAQSLSGGAAAGLFVTALLAVRLPLLGQELGACVAAYPAIETVGLRVLDLVSTRSAARDVTEVSAAVPAPAVDGPARSSGVRLAFRGLSVAKGRSTILDGITLDVLPGTRVGIVGPSGAGKSTLLGVLLGWSSPSCGEVIIDGRPLSSDLLTDTAVIDPGLRLFRGSVLDNVLFGSEREAHGLPEALRHSELAGVLGELPRGLQTHVGEAGTRLSGGQGQRVRVARAMMRSRARLVILDEPFRGLPRETRAHLRRAVIDHWPIATMLFVSHDVSETVDLDHVVVMEGGRVVEQGSPAELIGRASRYREMLDAEASVHATAWGNGTFRRVHIERGVAREESRP